MSFVVSTVIIFKKFLTIKLSNAQTLVNQISAIETWRQEVVAIL